MNAARSAQNAELHREYVPSTVGRDVDFFSFGGTTFVVPSPFLGLLLIQVPDSQIKCQMIEN